MQGKNKYQHQEQQLLPACSSPAGQFCTIPAVTLFHYSLASKQLSEQLHFIKSRASPRCKLKLPLATVLWAEMKTSGTQKGCGCSAMGFWQGFWGGCVDLCKKCAVWLPWKKHAWIWNIKLIKTSLWHRMWKRQNQNSGQSVGDWHHQYGKEWGSSTWFIPCSDNWTLPTSCSPPHFQQTQTIPGVISMARRRSLAELGTICLPSNSSSCRNPFNLCTASSRLPKSTPSAGIWEQKGPSVTGRMRKGWRESSLSTR